jgi:hypothetical protein
MQPVSARYAIVGTNRSVLHAASWLAKAGASLVGASSIKEAAGSEPGPMAVLVAGDTLDENLTKDLAVPVIVLWDFEVGQSGVGAFASAVSGVSSVIGKADGAPGIMPVHVPEQWVGIFGASLALGLVFHQSNDMSEKPTRMDVSAADILRAFAEQNSGNHAGVPYGWRRNGLTAVEHGGVFPQGFFRCQDGHVAVQARSRQDWAAILAAFGNPDWSQDKDMQNPFKLSEDDSRVLPLLQAELDKRTMQDLLKAALETGAPMAPVLSPTEAATWNIFRPGFTKADGGLNLPFMMKRLSA